MLLQGPVNQSHLIRMMLENEYAFSVQYEDKKEIRCAHYKGLWTVAFYKNGLLWKTFCMDDTCNMDNHSWQIDPILKGFMEARKERLESKYENGDFHREYPAEVLYDILVLLAGHNNNIQTINIVQPGRNARIDEFTGEFFLAPREGEFKK